MELGLMSDLWWPSISPLFLIVMNIRPSVIPVAVYSQLDGIRFDVQETHLNNEVFKKAMYIKIDFST